MYRAIKQKKVCVYDYMPNNKWHREEGDFLPLDKKLVPGEEEDFIGHMPRLPEKGNVE